MSEELKSCPPASAERETPESDYLDASLRALCKEMASDGKPMDDIAWTEIYEAAIEGARDTERHLRATNADLTRRLELIEWQNQERLTVTWNDLHGAFVVQGPRQVVGNMGRGQTVIEALDAARAKDGKGTA